MNRTLVIAALVVASRLEAQSSGPTLLPNPSGPSRIGRITYDWVDSTRSAFLDPADTARREILVDVWYPTTASGIPAGYLPYLADFSVAMSDSVARRRFAPEYAAVERGLLRTHALENAKVECPSSGCSLLIFSHGGGVDRSLYTVQYEDLASHGYVVAAIAHTGDTHRVVFPGGRSIGAIGQPAPADPPEWSKLPRWRRDYLQSVARANQGRCVLRVQASDIRFVLDRMTQLARTNGSPFASHLDLTHIGALGHSAGGMAAALACQRDARIRACLNEDGAMGNRPFDRDSLGRTITQPFMYVTRTYHRPVDSDSALKAMEVSRREVDSVIDDVRLRQDTLLADTRGGAWRVTIDVPGMPHMGFSDEPLILAAADSAKTRAALDALRLTNLYTRAFFDTILRGQSGTRLDGRAVAGELVTVERFPPRP